MKHWRLISRLRHFRGHGIHSPLVYGLKREVFMGKKVKGKNFSLFKTLISTGIDRKTARELQNLHNYCNFRGFEIVDSENKTGKLDGEILYLVLGNDKKLFLERCMEQEKATVAIMDKRLRKSIDEVGNIRIERKHYTLIFNDKGLPVQTFKL